MRESHSSENKNFNIIYASFAMVIRDYGLGMTKEQQSKLFLNFSKLDEHSHMNRNGVGLGLSICQTLIQQMGGQVFVESEVNEGTKFTIQMAAKMRVKSASKQQEDLKIFLQSGEQSSNDSENSSNHSNRSWSSEGSSDGGEEDPNKPFILLVNDELFCLKMLIMKLKKHFNIETAINGLEAYQLVINKPIDYYRIVLTDINMPIMNGETLQKKLTTFFKEVKEKELLS